MGFKKGNQNIDSVFYGTDYVERMYLGGGEPFFQASYLDFYKTNFFSIGLGQKKQIHRQDSNGQDKAISLIKTEWSSQYGYQLEIKQDKKDDEDFVDYKHDIFRDNFSFILPEGKYLANVRLKNISSSTGTLYCKLLKKGETSSQDVDLTSDPFYDGFYHGKAQEVYVDKDTEVYLGMYTKNLNPGKTSIFSLELFPATGEKGNFTEVSSLMARGRKKEIYNSGASSINITIPATAFYEGESYPVQYIDSDAFNYKVTENGTTETSQPLTKISAITVEGNNMIGFGNRAFQNCSSCTSFSCTSSVFQGGLFADNAAFEGCGALENLTLSIVKNINGLRESQNLNTIFMGGRDTYSFDDSFARNTSIETIHWKNKDSFGTEKAFTADFVVSSFEGCTNLKTLTSNDYNAGGVLGENTVFRVGPFSFADCTSLNTGGAGFGSNTGPLYSRISPRGFSGCTGLTSVDFGTKAGARTSIGSEAFYGCTEITTINLPITVSSIGSGAFSGCSKLTSINIPFIGESATSTKNRFEYIFGTVPESLTTVGFSEGNNITKIPDYAFENCSGLTSITIPDGVTSIGKFAFNGCSGLTSINIPNSVTSIGKYAFYGCSSLTSITIPDGVTSIGDYAFRGCSGLTSINIPNSVTSIGASAFRDCSGLTSINIPNSVTSIGDSAFDGCSGLTNATIGNSVTSIGNTVFIDCRSLKSITIPDSVTSIGNGAFNGCSGLTSINIPNSVTSIGAYAFQGCSSLTSATIGNGVTSIGEDAFNGCSSLTSLTTPADFLSSFDKTNLRNVTVTKGNIPNNAFNNCTNLTTVILKDGVTSIGSSAFDGCSGLKNLTAAAEHLSAFTSTVKNQLTTVTITKGEIPNEAFKDCTNLTTVILNGGVTSIGANAFYDCSGLTSITMPNSVTSIGSYAFSYCRGLTSITIPDSVTSIGYGAFEGCSGLTSINIPNSVTSIGATAFANCRSLKSITIPDSVTSIGANAFFDCSGLTSITMPNSVTSIGSYAFSYCSGLTSITIPDGVTSIGDYAFEGCSGLTIYAEAATKPSGWSKNWNSDNRPVVWGYKG